MSQKPEAFSLFDDLASSSSEADYTYNYTYVPPLALVDALPAAEKPTVTWYLHVVWQSLQIARNRLTWALNTGRAAPVAPGTPVSFSEEPEAGVGTLSMDHLGLPPIDLECLPPTMSFEEAEQEAKSESGPVVFSGTDDDQRSSVTMIQQATGIAGRVASLGITNPLEVLGTVLRSLMQGPAGRPASIDDYKRLFATFPLPWFANSFDEDETFAWMRVAGWNPLVIERVPALTSSFPVTEAHYLASLRDPGDSLGRAGAEGRLFLANYLGLERLVNGSFPGYSKYGFAPKALFALPRGSGTRRLLPIAIQCGQDPRDYPIFTAADGELWRKAKLIVSSADANHHELISHLGRTHFVIEPFVIATFRTLPERHPVSLLLRPHFEGTLSINDSAQRTLIAAGHEVDVHLAGTIEASRTVAVETALSPYFNHGFLPEALAARGVMSPELDYPYRDDALLVWAAIERWVSAYLGLYYASDAAVAADEALGRWGAEVAGENGGRLPAFGEDGAGRVATVAYLARAVTMIIFTASAQHAAVNSAQEGVMRFVPAAPLALYRAAPLSKDESDRNPTLDMLPPLAIALKHLEFCTLLGGVRYTKLGDYRTLWFRDPQVYAPLAAFQEELAAIGAEIARRNQTRFGPYPYLIPEQIPQSINM